MRIIIYWHIFHSSGFHHICNIKCRPDCRYSPQNMFNARNFIPHKKPISLLNMPICTQGMQRTWWPEACTIIVTGPYWMRSWKVTCMSDLWIFFLIFDTRLCRGLPLGKISFWLLFYMIPDLECLCWHKKSHSTETWCIPHKYRFFLLQQYVRCKCDCKKKIIFG